MTLPDLIAATIPHVEPGTVTQPLGYGRTPRDILGLDPARFLSDGDAVMEWRANDDDNVPHCDEWECDESEDAA